MARRQHSVRLFVLIAAICGVFLLIGGAADAEAPPGPTVQHVVSPGESLWSIAADHLEPGEDIRALIEQIRDASSIDSSTIYTGQLLLIPQDRS